MVAPKMWWTVIGVTGIAGKTTTKDAICAPPGDLIAGRKDQRQFQ
jgi:hypothetical protein